MLRRRKKKIGLALGSGSARGLAHIGVVQALAEADVRVDCVAGTSMGALVGAFYAAGAVDSLRETFLRFDWKQMVYFFDVVFPKSGLIDGKRISDLIRAHVKAMNIEDLPVPFRAVATDLTSGREVVMKDGDIIDAVRASISVPGIFTPLRKGDMVLVDGGLVNPVPVDAVREMGADLVIAVNLNKDVAGARRTGRQAGRRGGEGPREPGAGKNNQVANRIRKALDERFGAFDLSALKPIRQWITRDTLPNIFEVLLESISIMEARITETRLKIERPDVLVEPNLGHFRFLDFNRAQEAIDAGYREARAQIGQLQG